MTVSETLPGRLIAVEGLDCSGKSAQIYLVHQWLQGLGCPVFFTEWNSSVLVQDATRKGKKRQLLPMLRAEFRDSSSATSSRSSRPTAPSPPSIATCRLESTACSRATPQARRTT